MSCRFCYLFGNPDGLAIARGAKVASLTELDTRLRYYDPEAHLALFKAQWEINEFLIDPSLGHVLTSLRAKTQSTFFFVTNGNPLTEDLVDLLAANAPVDLIVSINTTDPEVRQNLMRERASQTARAGGALDLLQDRKIPFGVSIAAFPDVSRSDFERVIAAAEAADAAFVRVNLPGHTNELPPDPPFDTAAHWALVIEWVQEARTRFRVPIISIPSAYESNFHQKEQHGAHVWGSIVNSPASIAGIGPGDLITRIGMFNVRSRSELISLALLLQPPFEIELIRNGASQKVTIPDIPLTYPYLRPVFGKYLFPHGLVVAPSLGPLDAAELGRILETSGATCPVMISSPLMIGAAQQLVRDYLPAWNDRVRWVTAYNEYLGGNIQVLDMATAGDLARAVERDQVSLADADLLIVPGSGFNQQGRDIVGRHWSELGHRLGVPVVMLNCQQFLF